MRKGIADLHRRAEVSQAVNDRYAEALASANDTTPLRDYIDKLCRPTQYKGRRMRALRPYSPEDGALLEVLSRGEFVINGFRNRDLRSHLYLEEASGKDEERRRSGAISRRLALLRAHKLLKKVPRSHRYQLTDYGRKVVTALSAAREADVEKLTKMAA